MNAAELLVRCLENEGVDLIFGLPGEENIAVMDVLLDSPIRFITTRHEQGAAFMADVYGRLTGRAGVCLSTLGPGATNLITGVADANMDSAPLVAIAGQGATTRLHKESHQILDLVDLFRPITKYAASVLEPEIVPEVVRKAFKVAQAERPGATFIEFPENIAGAEVAKQPIRVQKAQVSAPPDSKVIEAAEIISRAKCPVILAGNGVIRQDATRALRDFATAIQIPVANTFMAAGVMPSTSDLSLGSIGLKATDLPWFALEAADVVICVGYDLVEYHPEMWNPNADKTIINIDALPAEVDEHYVIASGVLGDITATLRALASRLSPRSPGALRLLRQAVCDDRVALALDEGFPVKPQKILWDLREALAPSDIVISDVGAHKMWTARMYRADEPNTCIISNGFASMGIGVPGGVAAKLAYPERKVVVVTGDAGFMMNSQEIETALRANTPFVILIWSDSEYGLITWHQLRHFGRPSNVAFKNPDFVKYAESFGARGYRVQAACELAPILKEALESNTVAVIDCPVDYGENMKLTARLAELRSPL
jgi:acetolactate synthase I/II/III large subunit